MNRDFHHHFIFPFACLLTFFSMALVHAQTPSQALPPALQPFTADFDIQLIPGPITTQATNVEVYFMADIHDLPELVKAQTKAILHLSRPMDLVAVEGLSDKFNHRKDSSLLYELSDDGTVINLAQLNGLLRIIKGLEDDRIFKQGLGDLKKHMDKLYQYALVVKKFEELGRAEKGKGIIRQLTILNKKRIKYEKQLPDLAEKCFTSLVIKRNQAWPKRLSFLINEVRGRKRRIFVIGGKDHIDDDFIQSLRAMGTNLTLFTPKEKFTPNPDAHGMDYALKIYDKNDMAISQKDFADIVGAYDKAANK